MNWQNVKKAMIFALPNYRLQERPTRLSLVMVPFCRKASLVSGMRAKESISLFVQSEVADSYNVIGGILCKQVNSSSLDLTDQTISEAIPAVAGKEKFYIVTATPMDMGSQKQELIKELEYLKGFLLSVEKKLGNEKFVNNAKAEVVEIERKKKADAEMKIRMIEESLTTLN
jgi:valyl-tRNA synthetase